MTTTILDGETYPEALQRRYAEEAAIEKRINIIELAKEAGIDTGKRFGCVSLKSLERFKALVRADLMKQVIDTCEDEMVEQDDAGHEDSCALIHLMRKLEKLK